MFDKNFNEECDRATQEYSQIWKQKKKLNILPLTKATSV